MTQVESTAEIVKPSRSVGDEIRDCMARYVSALGGDDQITDEQRAACKRAAELVTLATALRYKALGGREVDVGEFTRVEALADDAVSRLMLPKAKTAGPTTLAVRFVGSDADGRRIDSLSEEQLDRWLAIAEMIDAKVGWPQALDAISQALQNENIELRARIREMEAERGTLQDAIRANAEQIRRASFPASPPLPRREPRDNEEEISRRLRGLPSPTDDKWGGLAAVNSHWNGPYAPGISSGPEYRGEGGKRGQSRSP